MTDKERATLIKYRDWLLNDVIPGFQRARPDDSESIRRCMLQVMDIDWLLADPSRKVLNVMERKPYADRQITLSARRKKAPETQDSYPTSNDDEREAYSDD